MLAANYFCHGETLLEELSQHLTESAVGNNNAVTCEQTNISTGLQMFGSCSIFFMALVRGSFSHSAPQLLNQLSGNKKCSNFL
jgi:hypothetical protein